MKTKHLFAAITFFSLFGASIVHAGRKAMLAHIAELAQQHAKISDKIDTLKKNVVTPKKTIRRVEKIIANKALHFPVFGSLALQTMIDTAILKLHSEQEEITLETIATHMQTSYADDASVEGIKKQILFLLDDEDKVNLHIQALTQHLTDEEKSVVLRLNKCILSLHDMTQETVSRSITPLLQATLQHQKQKLAAAQTEAASSDTEE